MTDLWFKPVPRKCYFNAQRVALGLNVRYVEGSVMDEKGRLVRHAWNIINGRMVDFTPGTHNWFAYTQEKVCSAKEVTSFVEEHGIGMSMMMPKLQHTSMW